MHGVRETLESSTMGAKRTFVSLQSHAACARDASVRRSSAFEIKRLRTLLSVRTFVDVQNFFSGPAFSADS